MNLEPQLFVGDASDAEARVYATLPRACLPTDAQLVGELVGPHCRYSQTLPARIRLIDRGPGPTLLAEAIVPDPCFWTPDLPFTYSAELRLVRQKGADPQGASTPTFARRTLGIRRLGVHGTSIFLDAKRFVLRGVRLDAPTIEYLKAARQAASALYIDDANDQLLQEASEEGVLLVVRLAKTTSHEQLLAGLARLGRWPAVAIVILDPDIPAGKELRQAARNTLLAQHIASVDGSVPPAPWSHLLWWQIDAEKVPTAAPPHSMPVIVYRPTSKNATIQESRRGCDGLQADLAPLDDFAGYFT